LHKIKKKHKTRRFVIFERNLDFWTKIDPKFRLNLFKTKIFDQLLILSIAVNHKFRKKSVANLDWVNVTLVTHVNFLTMP